MKKERLNELEAKLKSDISIIYLTNLLEDCYAANLKLVGGAVVDILEGRKPKDFDFIDWNERLVEDLMNKGFAYICATKSAITLKNDEVTIQLIHTELEHFDFTISQTYLSFGSIPKLKIDPIAFENKLLIPVSFDEYRDSMNSLKRIPHWQNKGYKIHELTYKSLLNVITKTRELNS